MAASSLLFGYSAKSAGSALERVEYEPQQLKPDELRVAVTHCGVCHTDVQVIDNLYQVFDFPIIPGHEVVGNVSEIGPAVTSLKVGDRVGVGWQSRSCGKCEYCLKGEEHLCRNIADCGTWTPCGGFGSSVIVDHRFAYPIPATMPSEIAAVLMCAGLSVYAPLRKYNHPPGQRLAILGVGGLGHLAIQFAHALGYEITVISTSPEKKQAALDFGADDFFLASDQLEYHNHVFYFDLLLCTAPGKLPWDLMLNIPKKGSRIVLVSFPDMEMNPTDLIAHELSISASFLGSPATMREMLSFAQAHHITPVVELMPMSKVNEAIQKVRDNQARYRIVLVNN